MDSRGRITSWANCAVRVEDGALAGEGHGRLPHRLDVPPIGAVGRLQREHPIRLAMGDDEGVDLVLPDGADRLLGLLQPPPQFGDLPG